MSVKTSAAFPPPNATRAEIDAWLAANAPPPEPEHEAPPVANGPSPVCNACGKVRVPLFTPFCKGCLGAMAAAGVGMPR
ncbi:hypothetical protein WMF30_10680 [Sorangium sp. So ce134]